MRDRSSSVPTCEERYRPRADRRWGQAGSRYTRDFEDVVAWLAQQMAKTPIAALLRIACDTVGQDRRARRSPTTSTKTGCGAWSRSAATRSVYRRHQRYLTTVADHRTGAIVWCAAGPQRRHPAARSSTYSASASHSIRAVSIHMSRRLREGDPRQPARRRNLLRPVPRRPPRPARRRPGPPRRMERPRTLPHWGSRTRPGERTAQRR